MFNLQVAAILRSRVNVVADVIGQRCEELPKQKRWHSAGSSGLLEISTGVPAASHNFMSIATARHLWSRPFGARIVVISHSGEICCYALLPKGCHTGSGDVKVEMNHSEYSVEAATSIDFR